MANDLERPFDSIESTQEFMALLQDSIAEALQSVHGDLDATPSSESRRTEALLLAIYKMEQLSTYVRKSQRILNDLRTIRKLLVEERSAERAATAV